MVIVEDGIQPIVEVTYTEQGTYYPNQRFL